MTTSNAMPPLDPESAAQRWLDREFRSLADDLHSVLELDAGLCDILVRPPHEQLVRDLDRVLDLGSGLRDILGTTASELAGPGTDPEPAFSRGNDIAALNAILAARRNKAVRHSLTLLSAARAGDVRVVAARACELVDCLAFEGANAITFARARVGGESDARSLVDKLANAVLGIEAFANQRDTPVDSYSSARAYARSLVGTLVRTRLGVSALNVAFAFADAKVDAFSRGLVNAVSDALAEAHSLARDFTDALTIPHSYGGSSHGRVPDTRGQAATLVRRLLATVDVILTQGLSSTLPDVDLAQLSAERIGPLLDDFTDADLREANLADADLTGLQWSNATRWPLELVSAIRRQSRETEPGSGRFVIVGKVHYTETTNR